MSCWHADDDQIDSNLNALGGAAGRLNQLARATGKEVDEQNLHLERINAKVSDHMLFSNGSSHAHHFWQSTKVDDQIALNRARLDRFK